MLTFIVLASSSMAGVYSLLASVVAAVDSASIFSVTTDFSATLSTMLYCIKNYFIFQIQRKSAQDMNKVSMRVVG